jgi:glycosyltransferase involved in cell wall biosynthesis
MTIALPPQPTCDISVYVACFNEEKGIIPSIETVVAALREMDLSFDIIVVDDASSDRSVEIIQAYMRQHPELPITLVINEVNQGIGHNFVDAAFLGGGKYYRMICGDNVETKDNFIRLLKHLGEVDLILSYQANASARSLSRRIISRTYTWLVNLLSGHRIRYYNNLPIFLRHHVIRWHPSSHGFGFQADLVTRILDLGASYIEVPAYIQVTAGERRSKAFRLRNICSVLHTLEEILARRLARTLFPRLGRHLHHGQQIIRGGLAASAPASTGCLGSNGDVVPAVLPQEVGPPQELPAEAHLPGFTCHPESQDRLGAVV